MKTTHIFTSEIATLIESVYYLGRHKVLEARAAEASHMVAADYGTLHQDNNQLFKHQQTPIPKSTQHCISVLYSAPFLTIKNALIYIEHSSLTINKCMYTWAEPTSLDDLITKYYITYIKLLFVSIVS